jgi:YD repeat-containing protein
MKTKTYYVNDKSQLSGLSTSASVGIDSLKLQYRIATPIQVESYRNNVLQSTQRTSYKYWPTVGIVASDTIQSSKGSLVLEDRVVYHSYDDRGNPREVSKADGTKVYYVWGYDKTQPIAKIEGVTGASLSSSQQSLITAAITASNNDTNAGTEATLRTKLSDLRNGFSSTPWVQVTTLTYDPLIGVTSITDARGNVMYYVYDSFNRLQYIKDKDGYVLKEHKYHYKN